MTQKPLPVTKDGYRYHWGEDDEPLCSEYIRKINSFDANKRHLHNFTKRKIIPPQVKLSENDRASQLKLNENHIKVTGEKGYSMVRATHGVNRGKYYYEVYIDSMPENTATRIGWGQCYANLQAPLGYDHYGYSWRSRFGTKFHQARGKTYDRSGGYKQGDTIGCMIELPYGNSKNLTEAHHLPPSIKTTGYVVNFKKKDAPRVLEEKDEPPVLKAMKPLVGSKISFYKNGKCIGIAFEDIFEGFYFPTISLYKDCTVTVNFGPKFQYQPEERCTNGRGFSLEWEPLSRAAEVAIIDNLISDMLHIVDQENDVTGNKLDELVNKANQV